MSERQIKEIPKIRKLKYKVKNRHCYTDSYNYEREHEYFVFMLERLYQNDLSVADFFFLAGFDLKVGFTNMQLCHYVNKVLEWKETDAKFKKSFKHRIC